MACDCERSRRPGPLLQLRSSGMVPLGSLLLQLLFPLPLPCPQMLLSLVPFRLPLPSSPRQHHSPCTVPAAAQSTLVSQSDEWKGPPYPRLAIRLRHIP